VQKHLSRLSKRYWILLTLCFNLIPYLCHADGAKQCKSVNEVVQILGDPDWVPQNLELLVTVYGTQDSSRSTMTKIIDRTSTVSICNGFIYWNTSDIEGAVERKERVLLTQDIYYWIKPDNSYTTKPLTDNLRGLHLNPILMPGFMINNMSRHDEYYVPLADFIEMEAEISDIQTSCIGSHKVRVSANYESSSSTINGYPIKVQNQWTAIVDPEVAGRVASLWRSRTWDTWTKRIFEIEVKDEAVYNGFRYPSQFVARDWEESTFPKGENELRAMAYVQVLKSGDEVAPIDVGAVLAGLR